MEHKSLNYEQTFIILTLFGFILFSWYVLALTIFSIFYKYLIIAGIAVIVYVMAITLKRYNAFTKASNIDIIVTIFVLIFALFSGIFAHDTFYGGRDPGIYSTYSIYLANNHALEIISPINNLIPDFLSPGSYKFIGNSKLISQFHFGYIAWLATNYSLFGIIGIKFANFIPICVSLTSIYLIGKKIKNEYVGISAILLFAMTFPMVWFSRQTVTEIFSIAILWFGVLCVLNIIHRNRNIYIVGSILSIGLLPFVRIEGIIFFSFLLVYLFSSYISKNDNWSFNKYHLILIIILTTLILYYYTQVQPRYLHIIHDVINHFLPDIQPSSAVLNSMELNPSAIRHHFTDFIYMALSEYNLQIVIMFIPLIFIKSIIKVTDESKKILLVLFFMLPGYVYLIVPFITLDQPWFLRRYMLTVLPSAYLFITILLYGISKKKHVFITAISIVFVLNVLTASPIIFFSENDGMVDIVEDISKQVSKNDLILVDRYATGSYKMADPLFFIFERPALWWDESSLSNLKQNANLENFNDVYILTNNKVNLNKYFNSDELELVYQKNITLQQLEITVDLNHYPHTVDDVYDMDYSIAKKLMSRPSEIQFNEYNIKMYKTSNKSHMFK